MCVSKANYIAGIVATYVHTFSYIRNYCLLTKVAIESENVLFIARTIPGYVTQLTTILSCNTVIHTVAIHIHMYVYMLGILNNRICIYCYTGA